MRSTGVDITEESKQRELLAKSGLKHLKDGEAEGSLRSVLSEEEGEYFEWEDGKWQERQYQLGEGAVALGQHTKGSGKDSFAQGFSSVASGNFSHAEGTATKSVGECSHAEGRNTEATGNLSHAEGEATFAKAYASHTEGQNTIVNENANYAHAEGISAVASGVGSHAEGMHTKADGTVAHSEGVGTTAQGDYSHAEGNTTTAIGEASHTEGRETTVQDGAIGAHAEGYQTVVHGEVTHEDGTTTKGDYAHVEGENTQAYGKGSHAEGLGTQAKAQGSHAEGNGTIANGQWSHAAGQGTTANGMFSHAEGMQSVTENAAMASHVEGYQCVTKNNFAHAEGNVNIAEGFASHAEGGNNTAKGQFSHAEGNNNFANAMSSHAEGGNNTIAEGAYYGHAEGERNTIEGGNGSHVEGNNNKVNGQYAHAEGQNTVAEGLAAHAEGWGTTASTTGSPGAHAEGVSSKALELAAHAEGQETTASGVASHAEGFQTVVHGEVTHEDGTITKGDYAHAEGRFTHAYGYQSHAEGYATKAVGDNSHAEGAGTTAGGVQSHAEGAGSRALGDISHAEGSGTTASGSQSHSEGGGTTAGGAQSHAEGAGSVASGEQSHSEGGGTTASGAQSHAEGAGSVASGVASHAGGYGTIASHEAQTAIGKYNKDVDSLFSVGNGVYDEATKQPVRKDAFRVERDGKIYILDKSGNEILLQGLVLEDKAESVFVSGGDKDYGIFLSISLDDIDGDTSEEVVADFERHIGESILLYMTCTTTSSADSGNLVNQGSYALVNLKFSSMENGTYAWIPEMLLRNGMRNGDVRVTGGDVSEYVVGFGSSVEGSVMTVRLIANNTSNCTLIWRTGEAVPIADKSVFFYNSITTGYVHAAKWAKEDCCLEMDSHLLGNEDFYACGFSAAENEDDGGNLDYLYLFPENQSKYTAYQKVSSFGGCPVDDLTDFRVTVSKISASNRPSGNRVTNGLVYEVEQEVVGLVAGEEVKFTRTGSVDLTNGNSCNWRPWKKFVLVGLDEVADDGVLVLTQENLNDYYDADTEILQVPAGTKTILFNLPDTKVAAIQMEGVTSGQRITVAGSFVPSKHYSEDKNVDGRFSSYLYTYRSGYNMGSHDGRLEYAFEDFMYYYGVWYSKGY